MKTRKTIGLALGSGAYRGFAHIGVIRSLEKHNIPVDYLSGTSIGAWVGAYYALFKNVGQLEKDLIDNQTENMSLLLDFGWNEGLIGGDKFLAYLRKKLKNSNFSELQIPLAIVATDLVDGRAHVFKEGDVATAVRASTAVPLVFKALGFADKLLVDGGLSDPVPVSLVRNMGADVVIGVNLYNPQEFIVQKYTEANVVVRSTMIMLANFSRLVMKSADVIIEPDTSRFLKANNISKYFDKKIADEIIRIGEEATDRLIPRIKKLLD